ncbi:NAD-dependent malic enzyme [Synechococcus sp. Tobar12-5m-g]|jgi:malate dehydrogenase (oxaloacetate-decarboxylating)|uniref:NAD-dependent malic enzyme n=1 Tax=unclassified Synechococcus TaxID=2626047 RepID=UPI0020CE2D1E|nr:MULTISPECIES: NAD-dependent malic enzyme [unclassified Synechococcus]MCP9771600.1 NAD-dependent malic enzyme [Synechococcus sp. Tobar12-5m-g]MCP9872540.1 NAD-dependent malic enzyme [Synechococcus sp. Cruz CV-v-12]
MLPLQTRLRGLSLLADPGLNKGTAFSHDERRALGLEGLLPEAVETLDTQVERTWRCFQGLASDLEKFRFAQALRQSSSTLFYRFLSDHIDDLLPIVYTPTVGAAIQRFSLEYRTPSGGVYLSRTNQHRLDGVLRQATAGPVDLILVTDAEGILGIGDQGIGGIEICQGKLAVYTLCAGLDPHRVLPVVLDVGTNRQRLIDDPLYPGCRQPRLVGPAYDAFIAAFVAAVKTVYPGALLHWEDFGVGNAHRNLDTYRHRLPSFNDDIQGTRGVACAVVLAASRAAGVPVQDHRIVVFGAGTAGCGIAEGLVRLLRRNGLSEAEARRRIWLIDREGLLLQSQAIASPLAARFARSPDQVSGFSRDGDGRIGLLEVVRQVGPSVLIGTSTVAGAFSQAVVETMARAVERPIILPLSNPTHLAEATPRDLLAWTGGRALVATGSPFDPVPVEGVNRRIGQCNNCFLFPGLGFAAVAVGAREVSEAMVDAGLEALAERIPASLNPTAPLMPDLDQVGAVARAVAEAVALSAVEEGLATRACTAAEAIERLDQATWTPVYRTIEAV